MRTCAGVPRARVTGSYLWASNTTNPVLCVISAFERSLMWPLQESRDVAEKPHDAVVKFDTYRNLEQHRAVLHAISRLLFI